MQDRLQQVMPTVLGVPRLLCVWCYTSKQEHDIFGDFVVSAHDARRSVHSATDAHVVFAEADSQNLSECAH